MIEILFVSLRLKLPVVSVNRCCGGGVHCTFRALFVVIQAITPCWFPGESCVLASQECVTKQSLVNTVIVDLYNLYARPFAATLTDNLARKTRGPEWRSKQPIYERVFPVSVPVSSVRPPDRGYGYPSV